MAQKQHRESGWPARDFDEAARAFLGREARQRVQEQLAFLRAQDVKIAALFTASAGLFALSGLLGSLQATATPEAILTLLALFASLAAWLLLGVAYWTREIGSGLNLEIIREHYAGVSAQELQDASLESSVEDFTLNQQTIAAKAKWIKRSFIAVAAQLLFLFAAVLATAVAG